MLDEFQYLNSKVRTEFHNVMSDHEHSSGIWESVSDPIYNCVLHLWDVGGELKSWLVNKMCRVLVGSCNPDTLPDSTLGAFRREIEFRGGPNAVEMALSNIGDAAMGIDGENKGFSDEEIEKARESKQGLRDYNHNVEKYFKSK